MANKCGECAWLEQKSRGKTCIDRGKSAEDDACPDFEGAKPASKNAVLITEMSDTAGAYLLISGDEAKKVYSKRKELTTLGWKWFKKDTYWWHDKPADPVGITNLLEELEDIKIEYDIGFEYVAEDKPSITVSEEIGDIGGIAENSNCSDCRFFRESGAYHKTDSCRDMGKKPTNYCPKFELEVRIDIADTGMAEHEKVKLDHLVDDKVAIDEEVKDINRRWEENKDELMTFMLSHGTVTEPKETSVQGETNPGSRVLFSNGWKVLLSYVAKMTYSEATAIKYCTDHKLDAVASKPILDWDRWEALRLEGKIPSQVVNKVAKPKPHYTLRLFATKEQECPACGQIVDKSSTFCSHCGTNMKEKIKVCSSCGGQLTVNMAFCGQCGTKAA